MLRPQTARGSVPSRVILFLGAPGSGKGTQSSSLAARLGIPCLSTGETLRTEARRNTVGALQLRRILASGSLVSDDIMCNVIASRLQQEAFANGFILDGFPRTLKQARFLDDLVCELRLPRPAVIHLDVSAGGLLLRLSARRQCAKCGAVYNVLSRPSLLGSICEIDRGALVRRDDDCETVILRRLEDFDAVSQPVLNHYRNTDFYRIDGDRDLDVISSELMEIVSRTEICVPA